MSRPGVLPREIGRGPLSLLSAKSNQRSFDKLPTEAGIGPIKLFKFKDLHDSDSVLEM